MLSCVFLILYLAAASVNLSAARRDRTLYFAATKPMLLLLLCLYVFSRGGENADSLLVCALLSCFLGDVLLMPEGTLWFFSGGVFFLAGHILLILNFASEIDLARLPLYVVIPSAAVYTAVSGLVMFRSRKKAPALMQIPMLLYLLANSVMNVFALVRLFVSPGVWSALSFTGAILFFLSDCALFLLRYDAGRKRFYMSGFFVMLTYISGVLLIALGLAPPV